MLISIFSFQMWIQGSSNHKTSSLFDHASSQQHLAAMVLFRKDQACSAGVVSPMVISPIVSSLTKLDDATRLRMKRKFDVCYLMARECLSFTKYPLILELESRRGVDIGSAYKSDVSARSFAHFIAERQRQKFFSFMSNDLHFFSFLMDGTTDAGNLEDELIVIQFSWKDSTANSGGTDGASVNIGQHKSINPFPTNDALTRYLICVT